MRFASWALRGPVTAGALGFLCVATIGCSDATPSGPSASPSARAKDAGTTTTPATRSAPFDPNAETFEVPPPPAHAPTLPDTRDDDHDGDRIDDRLAPAGGRAWSRADDRVEVEVILARPLARAHLDAWRDAGGRLRHVYRAVRYGFSGSVPRRALPALAAALGPALHLIAAPTLGAPCLDEATRSGRVRDVWKSGFAGSASGFSGASDVTIAIVDTGVDPTHLDLAGRMIGWHDYTTDAVPSAHDAAGHGTHVASIATGTGDAFGTTSGTGTLRYTQAGDIGSIPIGNFFPIPIHTPAYLTGTSQPLTVSSVATFEGGGSATLSAFYSDDGGGWVNFGTTSGTTPVSLGPSSTTAAVARRYSGGLVANGVATTFAVANAIDSYPAVGDGFNTLRGVAPGSRWFGAKVFQDDTTNGSSTDFVAALDDLVVNRKTTNVKVVNMSLTLFSPSASFRAVVNTAVDDGLVVVAAAGNVGPNGEISDPGRAGKAITVGATTDLDQLTTYTSLGFASPDASEDLKPDLLAPGGSSYRSLVLAADSNTSDAHLSTFADVQPDDYTALFGTSMASPMVAGAAALVIQAIEQGGHAWDFDSDADPLWVKSLLLATATETGMTRENDVGHSPSFGRAALPKDPAEGYGVMNPDAAIEAVSVPFTSPLTGSATGSRPEWQRRAWARSIALAAGDVVKLDLAGPIGGDFDLYLYAGRGDTHGDPVLLAASTRAGNGLGESLRHAAAANESDVIVVKRASGSGSFTLTGQVLTTCGDGVVEAGELCDPGASGSTCCVACAPATDGTACEDGDACTTGDACQAGACIPGSSVCGPDASTDGASGDGASDGALPEDAGLRDGGGASEDGATTEGDGGDVSAGDASSDFGPLHAAGGCSCGLAGRTHRGRNSELGGVLLAGVTFVRRRRRRARARRA